MVKRDNILQTVLISIQPKWCELIASGKKTIEVRKTKPKIATPFKCYIYCTKPKMITKYVFRPEDYPEYMRPDKPVFCKVRDGSSPYCSEVNGNGKVMGEFVCDEIECFTVDCRGNSEQNKRIVDLSRVPLPDLIQYQGESPCLYGWNISDLVIYDKPKELSEFRVKDEMAIKRCNYRFRYGQPESVTRHGGWINGGFGCMKSAEPEWCENCLTKPLIRPPQSWLYVEELKQTFYDEKENYLR